MSSSRKNPTRSGTKSSGADNPSMVSTNLEIFPPLSIENILNLINAHFSTYMNKFKEDAASVISSNFQEMGSTSHDRVGDEIQSFQDDVEVKLADSLTRQKKRL